MAKSQNSNKIRTDFVRQQRTAASVARAALQMRDKTHKADLQFLTYLLDMVVQEAIARGEQQQKSHDSVP